jgi:hypothetical protein
MSRRLQRFDGAIAGVGTASGTRLVVGMWPVSPFGHVTDVMVERPDGRRILLAPGGEVAEFIAATYRFDEVRVEPTSLRIDGDRWAVTTASLDLSFEVGRRTALGQLLSLVPRPVARSRAWCAVLDPIARRVLRGVRTRGTAGGGRREYYGALDEHRVDAVRAVLEGADLGDLRPIDPPVRFGFGSTPSRPSLVRVTTTVSLPEPVAG